jgi:hypothetical protein
VDGFHVEGVAEDKGDLVLGAEVGDPVPGEEALDADDDVCAERGEGIEKELFVGGDGGLTDDVASLVENTDGEESGMEVDATVELVLSGVESHGLLRGERWGPEPASWLEGTAFLKIPR